MLLGAITVFQCVCLLWYMYQNQRQSTIPVFITPGKVLHRTETSLCEAAVPEKIRSWMGNELVTAVHPPVEANCQLLKDGDHTEQKRVLNELKNWTNDETVDEFYTKIQNCSYVRDLLSSDNFYISDTEKNFPLAYVILFYDNPQQIMRFLRVIYRPHNVYCLHPDGSATIKTLIEAFRKVASCFDNIFIPDELVSVTYKHISMVDAQLKCLHHLVNDYQHFQWKYASFLCGKELPFYSNRVFVEKLMELDGDSLVNAYKISDIDHWERFSSHFRVTDGKMAAYDPRSDKIPFGMQMYKSLNYISASQQFAVFLLTSPKVKALHRYMSTALMPDEEFYATAYMLPEAPTAHRSYESKLSLVKAFFLPPNFKGTCTGKPVHMSCVLDVRAIPLFHSENSIIIFFNKYFMEYDHVVMDCMEKRIVEQNKLEYKRDRSVQCV